MKRGRYVSIESSPTISGPPAVMGRVALDHPARALATEVAGRVWATDGATVYAIGISNPSQPQVLGQLTIPGAQFIAHLRVRGNFVYAVDFSRLYIVDATNPAAPVLRSSFLPPSFPFIEDIEVVGSFAYLSIDEGTSGVHSLQVLDISNPVAPAEVRRVGSGGRAGQRVSKAPNLSGLYAYSRSSTSAAIELWSLATPSNPSLSVANTTLDPNNSGYQDLLAATNTALCYFQTTTNSLLVFNPTTLARIGQPVVFPNNEFIRNMGVYPPFTYLTSAGGELIRVNVNTTPFSVFNPYLDVDPGVTSRVVTLNEGFSVLTGFDDLYFMETPVTGSPLPFAHLKPDAGFYFRSASVALVSGGTLFAVEASLSSPTFSRILAYHVTGGPAPGVTFQGFFDAAGSMAGLDAAFDSGNVRRVYYTVGDFSSGVLHILDATNLGSMTHSGSFSLTSGALEPVRFLGATASPAAPARVIVGGLTTQIVSVASAGFPSALGVVPVSSLAIFGGSPPLLWLADNQVLYGYNIGTPAAPVLQSTTRLIPVHVAASATSVKAIAAFAHTLAVSTTAGDVIKVSVTNPAAPVINEIERVSSGGNLSDLAWDGTNLHVAGGGDGYIVLPSGFNSSPREDPNHALGSLGTHAIVPICVGSPVSLSAHFVAIPAATSFQWQRRALSANTWTNVANGPTGTGSTISGATTATLMIGSATVGDAAFYRCQATNSCGSAITDTDVELRPGGYANCDRSTTPPVLNVNDFVCFLNAFAGVDPVFDSYPNCDGTTHSPIFNVNDFVCFQSQFVQGCP